MDWAGVKIGIEIHQRLESKKLFCNCYYNDAAAGGGNAGVLLRRRLRAVTGEMGSTDPAAAFEARKAVEMEYSVDEASACLVETDEEPPHALNAEALQTVFSIALALKAAPLDEIHVMRKTVVDGSAVSGFQRTALVAVEGKLETPLGAVGIPTVCIEEESAGINSREKGKSRYDLDRLGVPLVEIATDPSIKNGEHAAQVAGAIGRLLRATNRVQRGIGSIRQDVNVSIDGGARVEIKGVQELAGMAKLVENEVLRQRKLLEVMSALGGKKFSHCKPADVSRALAGAGSFVGKSIVQGNAALAMKLPHLKGVLATELAQNHRVGTELSDYARAAAGVAGIIHCGEDLAKYGITLEMADAVAKTVECGEGDAWVACVAERGVVEKALDAAAARGGMLFEGVVPKETRRADGELSRFMRPLPGSARMYPETDVPPVKVTKQLLDSAEAIEKPDDRVARYAKMGLARELAEGIALDAANLVFEEAVAKGADARLAAVTLLQTVKALKREGKSVEKLTPGRVAGALLLHAQGRATRQVVGKLLKIMCESPGTATECLEANKLEKFDAKTLERVAAENGFDARAVMREHRLNVDAAELEALCRGKKKL